MCKDCTNCKKGGEDCSMAQINDCLAESECEHCDNPHWYYPYGPEEGRHCTSCGAEWPVWK